MTTTNDEDCLPELDSLTKALALDLEAAKRETTVDWSGVSLWVILAQNPENPYGVRSKAGLRRLERAAKKRALHKRKPGYNLDGSQRKKRRKPCGRPKGSKNKPKQPIT